MLYCQWAPASDENETSFPPIPSTSVPPPIPLHSFDEAQEPPALHASSLTYPQADILPGRNRLNASARADAVPHKPAV